MPETSATKHTFTSVCVYGANCNYVSSLVDEIVEDDQNHALIFINNSGTWFHRALPFAVGDLCSKRSSPEMVLSMGIDGEVNIFTNPGEAGAATEQIDQSANGPSDLIPLRSIREIGNSVYACGMARHVYRRDSAGNWSTIDEGLFVPRDQRDESVGLNSIDGFDDSTIYTVGYQGEIWFFDGTRWQQQDSPTNVVLTKVRCCSNNVVYAAGLAGVLLRKTGDSGWEQVSQQSVEDDIWGMTYFKGQLYISTYENVFLLEDDDLVEVDMQLPEPISTAYLDSDSEIMWSVGGKDIAETDDGVVWRTIPAPD